MENDGIVLPFSAWLDIPKPENIGFPNDVWKGILSYKKKLKQGLCFFRHYRRRQSTTNSIASRKNKTQTEHAGLSH